MAVEPEYIRPGSLDQALAARSAHPDFAVLCGGTDLLVAANKQPIPPGIIDLFGLQSLCGVCRTGAAPGDDRGDTIVIGAATTYADIIGSELCQRELPALVAASREIGALQIQARGTVGGNIATSSPVGDSLPVLLALDASIEVASLRGRRQVPYSEFCTGYRQTALAEDELIAAIRIPMPDPDAVQVWRKVGPRRAQSISKVMMAAVARVDSARIAEIRIGLGAVADRPIRAYRTEAAVRGAEPGTAAAAARAALAEEIRPIDDVRSTARYRLRIAQNIVARFVASLAG
ncbi:MAG: FAD binding domain-containing protein [Myxococcota bacterium]